jgi:hypothetical protein
VVLIEIISRTSVQDLADAGDILGASPAVQTITGDGGHYIQNLRQLQTGSLTLADMEFLWKNMIDY